MSDEARAALERDLRLAKLKGSKEGKAGLSIENLWDLPSPVYDGSDPNELIRTRYLCRQGGLLLCAPTGVGKSVFALQCAIHWSFGLPAFGLVPTRPLKTLLIQAENDRGDIAEIRDGIGRGFAYPDGVDPDSVRGNLWVLQETALTGPAFLANVCEPALRQIQPDILMLDPALSYLGGDSSSQKDVGGFLRNGINPLLIKHNCGCMIVHHTTKPPRGEEKASWKAGDFAYAGAGSIEWAGWARAVLTIRSLGSHTVYELIAAKRGRRLGWPSDEGQKENVKVIKWGDHGICWVEGTDADRPSADATEKPKAGPAPICSADQVLAILPEAGCTREEWISAASGLGSRMTIQRRIAELSDERRVIRSHISGRWVRVEAPGTFSPHD